MRTAFQVTRRVRPRRILIGFINPLVAATERRDVSFRGHSIVQHSPSEYDQHYRWHSPVLRRAVVLPKVFDFYKLERI